MKLLAWWRRKNQADRFELYIRVTFYTNVLLSPLLIGGLVGLDLTTPTGALIVVHTAVCLLLVRAGVGHYLRTRERPVVLMITGAVLTAAGLADGLLVGQDQATALLLVLTVAYLSALSSTIRPRTSAIAGFACCGVLGLLSIAAGPGAAITLGFLLVSVILAYRVSLWMLGTVRELDRARHVESALAVAEERLRFARDLHDVVGRTLSVVSLKAELAAQLAKRGRAEAVDEMLEVRRIAQDSLAELRAVVGGYRSADLGVELAGARALLASAGIECRVIGDGGGLPEALQGTLGWVVREGTTNMLRHSEARGCTVTLRTLPATVTLLMENDGVVGRGKVRFGGGLIGLTERIAGLGGTVTAERQDPDAFRLAVEIPLVAA